MDILWGRNYCQYFRIKNNRWPLLSTYCVLDIASHALKAPSQRAAQCNGLCWAISVLTVETVEPEGSETTLVPVRLWAQASAAAGGTPLGWHLTGGRKARMQPRHFYLLFSLLFLFIYFLASTITTGPIGRFCFPFSWLLLFYPSVILRWGVSVNILKVSDYNQ